MPTLYTATEARALLRLSRSEFARRERALPWIQEVLPRIGRRRLYRAAPIDQYVNGLWPIRHALNLDGATGLRQSKP